MRNLKLFILLFGALGLVSAFVPSEGVTMFEAWKFAGTDQLVIMLVALALPVVMGLLGLMRPPQKAWQGIVALAGFALAAVKLRIWEGIKEFGTAPLGGKLLFVAIIGGVVVSLLATAKPENRS